MMTVGLIAAVGVNWVIGVDGRIPWHFKADAQRFKRLTMGSTVIMGKATWESLPAPLPGRRQIVLTRQARCADDRGVPSKHPSGSCEYFPNWDLVLLAAGSDQHGTNGDVWFIGGESVYREALSMPELEVVDITFVPLGLDEDSILPTTKIVRFPSHMMSAWKRVSEERNSEDSLLVHRTYRRRAET